MRHATGVGLELVKGFEVFSPTPYLCPARVWTNGWGHIKGVTPETPAITEEEGLVILAGDMNDAERAVSRLCRVPLSDPQFDALVSFTFNLGGGALQRSTLRQKVNREDHEDVPEEFLKWVWAAGRKWRGLIRRRAAEARLYESG